MEKEKKAKQSNNLKFPCLVWHAYILIAIALLGFAMIFSKDKCDAVCLYLIFLYAAFSLLLTSGVAILIITLYQQLRFAFYCRENYRQETPTENGSKNEISDEEKKRRQDYEENRTAFADYAKMLELAKVKTKTLSGEGDNKVEVQEERIDTNILKEILEKKPTENQLKNNTGNQPENK